MPAAPGARPARAFPAAAPSRSPTTTLTSCARNRLYLSTDGGRFWRALTVELPKIERVEFD